MPSILNTLEHQLGVFDGKCSRRRQRDGDVCFWFGFGSHLISPNVMRREGSMLDDIGRSKEFCAAIAAKVESKERIPIECKQYHEPVATPSSPKPGGDTHVPNKYEGMSPHDAIDAKRAKAEGHLNEAQMIRRMTTRNKAKRFY